MSTLKLLKAEIIHRKTNFALSLLALIAAASLFVASPTLMRGYGVESGKRLEQLKAAIDTELNQMRQETQTELAAMEKKSQADLAQLDTQTKRIMRDLGFNLRIVHRNTDLSQLYSNFIAFDMPEEYIQRLANAPEITKIAHLVATLKQQIEWEGRPCLLVGFAPEAVQSHVEQKSPMGFQIKPGTVYLGDLIAKGHALGDQVEILGKQFTVDRILPPHGTRDEDILIAMHLRDAQQLLGKPEKITEILALGCKCQTVQRVEEIQAQLTLVLPEAQVTEMTVKAIARDQQRKLVESHAKQAMEGYAANRRKITEQEHQRQQKIVQKEEEHHQNMLALLATVTNIITPLVILVCTIWVGLLAWSNVRERRTEIGLLRALGRGTTSVASLFLGKAVLLGLAGGAAGCLLGYFGARWLSLGLMGIAPENFVTAYDVLLLALLGAPLISAMASYLPTLSAVAQDPAVVLMDA